MRVLLLGATGNVGSRLLPSLLTHSHTVIAYVRSSSKLTSLLPTSLVSRITIVEGSGTSSSAIKAALLAHDCDAVINTAGLAAVSPWGKSELPAIFRAVVTAAVEAGQERGKDIRAWMLGGIGVLDLPGTGDKKGKGKKLIVDYMFLFPEHVSNLRLLESLPDSSPLKWSMLCPSVMKPAFDSSSKAAAKPPPSPPVSSNSTSANTTTATSGFDRFAVPTTRPPWSDLLAASTGGAPDWKPSSLHRIPFLGGYFDIFANVLRYDTVLEDVTDFMAADLEKGVASEFVGKKVGLIERSAVA